MGICFSIGDVVHVEDVQQRGRWEKDEKRVFQVKVRVTAKELRELVSQAQSADAVGPMLLNSCLVKGNIQVKECWPQQDGGWIREEVKRPLETIDEEE